MPDQVQQFMQDAAVKLPTAYYDTRSKEYLVQDSRQSWMALTEAQFKRFLLRCGFSAARDKTTGLSPIDHALLEYQEQKNVSWSGPLAGYRQGFYELSGTRLLVTSSPNIIEPQDMDWAMLASVIDRILHAETNEQTVHFYGWLKIAYTALRSSQKQPGQVVAFCGPHGCGKSLLQRLVTQILGGRVAKPFQAMVGGTTFNADLFGSEHLEIADESPSTDIRARRSFGAQIKNVTVNTDQRLHAKHRDAITLQPFWRMTVSLNDEQENLQILPPFDDSIEDKIMLFRAMPGTMPMPTGTSSERAAFEQRIFSEIPGLLNYLVTMNIPPCLKCERFGIKHYHNPGILELLNETAPELRLLSLIDARFFMLRHALPSQLSSTHESLQMIEMTALQIESQLTEYGSSFSHEATRLLSWNHACGTYLGRLARSHPHRVQERRTPTQRLWRITPPTEGEPA